MEPEHRARMRSHDEIKSLFRALGLEDEKDRERFLRMRRPPDPTKAGKSPGVVRITTDNTRAEAQPEAQDAELERSSQ